MTQKGLTVISSPTLSIDATDEAASISCGVSALTVAVGVTEEIASITSLAVVSRSALGAAFGGRGIVIFMLLKTIGEGISVSTSRGTL
jgi:hypothetical protein